MKILLLGAGGFIGANLTERLVNDGKHEITALDIEREKLDETGKSDQIRFIRFDIRRNEKELEHLTVEHDLIIDLVAMANPSLYVSNPTDVFKLNFTENLKIAEFCVKHRKRIIQFSTSRSTALPPLEPSAWIPRGIPRRLSRMIHPSSWGRSRATVGSTPAQSSFLSAFCTPMVSKKD